MNMSARSPRKFEPVTRHPEGTTQPATEPHENFPPDPPSEFVSEKGNRVSVTYTAVKSRANDKLLAKHGKLLHIGELSQVQPLYHRRTRIYSLTPELRVYPAEGWLWLRASYPVIFSVDDYNVRANAIDKRNESAKLFPGQQRDTLELGSWGTVVFVKALKQPD